MSSSSSGLWACGFWASLGSPQIIGDGPFAFSADSLFGQGAGDGESGGRLPCSLGGFSGDIGLKAFPSPEELLSPLGG